MTEETERKMASISGTAAWLNAILVKLAAILYCWKLHIAGVGEIGAAYNVHTASTTAAGCIWLSAHPGDMKSILRRCARRKSALMESRHRKSGQIYRAAWWSRTFAIDSRAVSGRYFLC